MNSTRAAELQVPQDAPMVVLMVIAALIGIASAVAIPHFIKAQARSELAQARASLSPPPSQKVHQ